MSRIGDLVIQAEENYNNEERLQIYRKKRQEYDRTLEKSNDWWQELDADQEYIERHSE